MNYQNRWVGWFCLGCVVMALTAGCEQNSNPSDDAMNVAGTWLLTEEDAQTTHVLDLEQNDTLLAGTMTAFFGTKAPAVGFVAGDSITLIITMNSISNSIASTNSFVGTVNLSGTIAQKTNSMSGTWWNSQQGQGTWSARK